MNRAAEDHFSDDDPIPPLTSVEDASPVHTDEDVRRRWRSMMGEEGFGRTTLWIVWYAADGRQLPVVVPIDDPPEVLEPEGVDNLVMIMADPASFGATSVALLLSRPGPGSVTPVDRDRANALLSGLDRARRSNRFPLKVWPIHLATTNSVRQLSVDDLVGA
jgi:hypothetical protein